MANHYGETPAKDVNQTKIQVATNGFTALQVGSAPQNNRRHIRIYPKSIAGGAIGLAYANGVNTVNPTTRQKQTSFTTPTDAIADLTLIPGGVLHAEPLGDNVTIFGRLINKAGATLNRVDVIVTEFS